MTALWDRPENGRAAAVAVLLGLAGCLGGQRDLSPIRLEPITTIGVEEGDGAMATWPRVSPRHPLGYRILVPQPGAVQSLPLVYDDSGHFVGTMGTQGDGPNDFVNPLFARFGPGDSVWIFDGARRALVFGPDRRFARTVPLPVSPWDAVVLDGGRIALTPAVFGQSLPWWLLDHDGTVIRRVGSSDSLVPSPRRIIAGQGRTVWTVAMTHRFRLDQWDLYGNHLQQFSTAPAWFVEHDEMRSPGLDQPPLAAVQDAWVDTDGRIWIVGKVADPEWREGLGASVDGTAPIVNADRFYDTVVEVHDGKTGEVLSEGRFDGAYPFIAEPGVLMRVRTTAAGWHRAELARVLVDHGRIAAGEAAP